MQRAQRVPIKTTVAASSKPLQIFDENVVPSSKPMATRKSTVSRTALGELTNTYLETRQVVKKPVDSRNGLPSSKRAAVAKSSSNVSKNVGAVTAKPSTLVPAPTRTRSAIVEDKDPFAFMEEDPKPIFPSVEKNLDFMEVEKSDDDQVEESNDSDDEQNLNQDEDIEDIDLGDEDDPQFCTEYVHDIFQYSRKKEIVDKPNSNYMDKQLDITSVHRTILIDWLSEVAIKFKLLAETMFLTVHIIDQYLSKKDISKKKLQLVGITALMIASKYEEIYSPCLKDFIYISADVYKVHELMEMEVDMLVLLDFNFATPNPLVFLRRFSKAARSDSRIHTLSKYLCEITLLDYTILKFLPSMIAASAVYLARKMTGISPAWYYSHYKESDLLECTRTLILIKRKQEEPPKPGKEKKFMTTTNKYSSREFYRVATIAAVDL